MFLPGQGSISCFQNMLDTSTIAWLRWTPARLPVYPSSWVSETSAPTTVDFEMETPEDISAGLPVLRQEFGGPVGGYPNIGYTGFPGQPLRTPYYTPTVLGEFARKWKDLGAQIIGGCCGTGPEHITAMRQAICGS